MRWLALLCAWWALALPVVAEGANRAQFNELLAEAEMQFEPPAGATSLASSANAVMNYERALRTADGLLEIRYAIRPLKRLRIDYDDPHGAAPDPNHIFPLMFEALAVRLSGGTHTPTQEYPQDRAQSEFNADWAAAAVFDVKSDFATDYTQGLVLALHRNSVADAYIFFLFDEFAPVREQLNAAMTSLIFTQDETVSSAR